MKLETNRLCKSELWTHIDRDHEDELKLLFISTLVHFHELLLK